MSRLTDNDRRFGSLTIGKSSWNPLRFVFSTGGEGDDHSRNHLTVYAFGYVARLDLPTLVQPYRIKHIAQSWDEATIARMGRNWYYEVFPREYGFSLHKGFLQIFHGPQTHSSTSTKSTSWYLPWTQWRHIRRSFYDGSGKHFATEWDRPRGFLFRDTWEARQAIEKACPVAVFEFDDYDGERIQATCRVEEREWRFGVGWFKWLSLFRKPKIRRSLDIEFSKEVGPEKRSWKGGTLGHGTEMLCDETPESAFRRYCNQDHRSKYRNFRLTFIGPAQSTGEKHEQ